MSPENSLQRYLDAQEVAYPTALAEMQRGRKQSHWMWYIFPQIQGLGRSATAQHYALASEAEAAAYLAHPVLGSRLLAICRVLLTLPGRDPYQLLGSPDDLKLHSSMTLFSSLPGASPVFQQVLDQYYAGRPDSNTLRLLREHS